MAAFAFYRLPYKQNYTLVMQNDDDPEELHSLDELNGRQGFVIAPFMPSVETPILLMHPDVVKEFHFSKNTQGAFPEEKENVPYSEKTVENLSLHTKARAKEKQTYAQDFECFHDQLEAGNFDKLVLARRSKITSKATALLKTEELFKKACNLYPRLFIALVSTSQSGTWLMATPEILLSGNGCEFTTMALAGTQAAPPSSCVSDTPVKGVKWTPKEIDEQQYVASYIEDVISNFSNHFKKNGPFTTMAAQLYHLRTDYVFQLIDTDSLGDLLDALFPTPAICGIPKEEARRFILANESIDRKYYSGFVGPLNPNGDTHLYVSLRCMNIHQSGEFDLYAGGGLLKESVMQKEWDETEAKMGTMRGVIGCEEHTA